MHWNSWRRHLRWFIPLVVADLLILFFVPRCRRPPSVEEEPPPEAVETQEIPIAPPRPWEHFAFPTPQTNLLAENGVGVFQPTGSGRLESALYGSVRTVMSGKSLVASFHEGVDIAPTVRDRAGRATDAVFAVADGTVAYVNRVSGNSNYGLYAVLTHADEIGPVYTLYAHLASVEAGLRAGQKIAAGAVLGILGHTSTMGIPRERSHLHFEIGLINNSRFPIWFRAQRLKPDHGLYNGRNLFAVDALPFFRAQQANPLVTFKDYLAGVPPAYQVVLTAGRRPDFFHRYPALWTGPAYDGVALLLACSEIGLPLGGRNATPEERKTLRGGRHAVLNVNEQVLGRNGARLIARRADGWALTSKGLEWAAILTY